MLTDDLMRQMEMKLKAEWLWFSFLYSYPLNAINCSMSIVKRSL